MGGGTQPRSAAYHSQGEQGDIVMCRSHVGRRRQGTRCGVTPSYFSSQFLKRLLIVGGVADIALVVAVILVVGDQLIAVLVIEVEEAVQLAVVLDKCRGVGIHSIESDGETSK